MKKSLCFLPLVIMLLIAVCFPIGLSAQQNKNVSGSVIDETGTPIIGAIIVLKGTNISTSSNLDGNFTLTIPDRKGNVLTFQYVGCKKKEITVSGDSKYNVTLETDTKVLQEVEIRGAYGTVQKRSDMVGSAFQVNSEDLKTLPANRIDNLLEGMVPGLTIDPNTDSQAARVRYNTRVRGEASLSASNEPLWIIDGVRVYTGGDTNIVPGMSYTVSPLSMINSDDIESMTVLKDAVETSIYGADGANGVILVTTKSGKEGKMKINASAQYGIAKADKSCLYKTLNASQYLSIAKEAWTNAGNSIATFPYQDNAMNSYSTTDTDWFDQYFDLGSNLNINFSISSGNAKNKSYVSAAYYREDQTVKGNDTQRFSLRANEEFKLSSKLKLNFIIDGSYTLNNIFSLGSDYYETLPIYSPYNEDGTYRLYNQAYGEKTTKFFNSVQEREENTNTQKTFKASANASLNYKIIDGLDFTAQFGVEHMASNEFIYGAKTNWEGYSSSYGGFIGYSYRGNAAFLTWTNVERLNFSRQFGKHKVSAIAGMELSSKAYNTLYAYGYGFQNSNIQEITYSTSGTRSGSSSANVNRSMSFFGQASYSYDGRYFLTANVRSDGKSNFSKYVRWGTFGSVGASWNINKESFFTVSPDLVNVLKLKASFGTNGNSRVGNATSSGTYSYSDSYSYMGITGATMSTPPNPGLSWETTYMTNIGLRLAMWNRLDIDVDAYYNKTVNLLSKLDVSRTIGSTRIYRNVGEIANKGIEVNINAKVIEGKKFNWTSSLNISHNENKILKLYGETTVGFTTSQWKAGYDKNCYFLVQWAGVDPRDGNPLWYDANGNITRAFSYDDRIMKYSSTPDLTGGWINTLNYGDFSLRIQLNYTIGGYLLSSYDRSGVTDGYGIIDDNQSVSLINHWQNPGDLSINPRVVYANSSKSFTYSTRHLVNKTSIKLHNIALSYNLPKDICSKMKMSSCQVSFVGDDLFIITPYKSPAGNSYKTLMGGFPMNSVYSLSVSVSI